MARRIWHSYKKFFFRATGRIGAGGNGTVFRVMDNNGGEFALKELQHWGDKKSYDRFRSEVEILTHLANKQGIVPIKFHHLPNTPSTKDRPFYLMPIGVPITNYLKTQPVFRLFLIFLNICQTLESLHSQEITHRDIKPENILFIDGAPVLSDFGLANFPKQRRVSALDEKIGPRWTIAPEMERISSSAEYKKADIYSLAKTLWILITGKRYGFEGQYVKASPISIRHFIDLRINTARVAGDWHYFSIVLLENLLERATSNDPSERPTAAEFCQDLEYWYSSNEDYYERNPFEWQDALKRIFPIAVPQHSEWQGVDEILPVLKILTEYDSLNHFIYPQGGGNDMEAANLAPEAGFLNLFNDTIVKPSRLYFEMIGNYKWSYFRLESEQVNGLTNDEGRLYDELWLSPDGQYHTNQAPETIFITRYRSGNFLIIFKTSPINYLEGQLEIYSGIHNKMSAIKYRDILTKYKAGTLEYEDFAPYIDDDL